MANEHDKVNPKLEQLLRQWGAQQAREEVAKLDLNPPNLDTPLPAEAPAGAAQGTGSDAAPLAAEVPVTAVVGTGNDNVTTGTGIEPAALGASPLLRAASPLSPRVRRPSGLRVVLRWAPLAAAAVMLIAAGWLYLESNRTDPQISAKTELAPLAGQAQPTAPADKVATETTILQQQLADAQRRLMEYQQQAATQRAASQLTVQKAQLETADAQRKLVDATAERKAAVDRVTVLDKELQDLRVTLVKAHSYEKAELAHKQVLERELDKAKTRLAAATLEVGNAHKQLEQSQKELAKVRSEIDEGKIRIAELSQHLRNVYISALAGDQHGLAAAREAVIKGKFLQRLAELRRKAPADTAQLLDRLEAVVLRLSTVELDNPIAVNAFRKLLADSKVETAVATALGGKPAADIRELLLEAQIILTEAKA